MTGPEWLVTGACVVAAITDLRSGMIYNWLTFPLMLAGVLHNVIAGQWWVGLLGFAVGFPLHFLLRAIGLEKAGDAKLLIGIGCVMGVSPMIETTLWRYVLMAPVGLIVLVLMGRLPNLIAVGRWLAGGRKGPAPQLTWIPFGPIILAGWLTAVFTTIAEIR